MNGYLLPNDAGWTEEKALLADLSHLNAEITRYVLRQLDVDAGRAEPISTNDIQAFGGRLVEMGERVHRRAKPANSAPVIEGEATPRRALDRGGERDMEDGL